MTEPQASQQHPLSLKVRRLPQASFRVSKPPTTSISEGLHQAELGSVDETETFPLTTSLVLPRTFGNIYLGECFRCYVSLSNHSSDAVKALSIKAELQTAQQIHKLLDQQEVHTINTAATKDFVVNRTLDAVGMHMLLITCLYLDSSGEQQTFRKYFKFQVLHPIEINPTSTLLQGRVFVEVSIQNMTQKPLVVGEVKIEGEGITVQQLTPAKQDPLSLPPDKTVVDSSILSGGDVVKLVHLVTLSPSVNVDQGFGSLFVTWRTCTGFSGTIRLPPLRLNTGTPSPVRVEIMSSPAIAIEGSAFDVRVRIVNKTTRALGLRLHFTFDQSPALLPLDLSGMDIGQLAVGGKEEVRLSFLPVKPGFHSIGGLRFVEKATNNAVSVPEPLASVFVSATHHSDT